MSYKTSLQSNNIDLQAILDMILELGLVDPPAPLIEFTINSRSYQAEEGMTWGEWINSKYNTRNYYDDVGYVARAEQGIEDQIWYIYLNGSDVFTSGVIQSGANYTEG